jgi:hypothetical protein
MTGFASRHPIFPAAKFCKLSMRSGGERFELVLVAVFTGVTANVVVSFVHREFDRADLRGVRGICAAKPTDRGDKNEYTDQECFDDPIHTSALPFPK